MMLRRSVSCALALLLLASVSADARGQLARTGKDITFKTTSKQHRAMEVLIDAWVVCLEPHLISRTAQETRSTIASAFQNQHSQYAVDEFHRRLVLLVQDDLDMPTQVLNNGGRELLAGSGAESPVGQLLWRAAASSSGHLPGSLDSLQTLHDRVLRRQEATLEALRGLAYEDKALERDQRIALQALAEYYAHCLLAGLPAKASSRRKGRFRTMVKECVMTLDTERAVAGVKAKVRGILRASSKPPERALGYLERDRALVDRAASLVHEAFWEELAALHAQVRARPRVVRQELRRLRKGECNLTH